MTLRGALRLLACWILTGDLLLSVERVAELLLQPLATATTTATNQQQRVRRAHLYVAGEEPSRARSTSSSSEGGTAPDGVLAHAVARGRELLQKGSLHEAADVLQAVLASKDDEGGALLHLAEVVAQLGQPRQAVALADRLLGLERLTPEARSFMLNRRGLYLQSASDFTGARQSYELSLQRGWQGRGINRHALWNLAALLHFQIFPSEAVDPNFSTLERAIELYRVALGRGNSAVQTSLDYPSGPESGSKDNDIGGPVDRYSIFRDLAAALLLAGRPGEAVAEVQHALTELTASTGGSKNRWTSPEQQSNSEDSNQEAAKGEADRAAEAATRRISTAFLWDSLSGAMRAAGDVPGALSAGKMALSLVDDEPGLYHNMALLLQKAGFPKEAQDAWLAAVALDSRFAPAFTGLGHLEGARGNIGRAREYYEASLAAIRSPGRSNANGGGHFYVRSGDEELTSLFLVATAVVPALYESNDHIAQVRRDFERGLDKLLAVPTSVSLRGLENPSAAVGSGALGYYIIYQGFEDLEIRRKLARSYWKFAPSLSYCAPFLANESKSWAQGQHHESEVQEASKPGSSPLGDLTDFSFGSLHGDATTGTGAVESTSSTTAVEPRPPPPLPAKSATTTSPPNAENLFAGAAHDPGEGTSISDDDTQLPCRRRRIKVGFLSAFFFHHSVGLLVEGVVTRLDRRRFETTAIFLQPHPTSASAAASPGKGVGEREPAETTSGSVGDGVYSAVRMGTEHVLDVPVNSLAACRHAIASLRLDVLVFTEIGMNFEAYFLSFARLARRSALFWGHAVTSGVSAFDALQLRNGGTRTGDGEGEERNGGLLDPSETGQDLGDASPGRLEGGPTHRDGVGGIDYFVSSWLFEDKDLGRLAQRKYSESLYLMEGLTTRFARPVPPKPAVVSRETLGIPRRPLPPRGARHSSGFGTAEAAAGGGGGGQDDGIAGRTVSDGESRSLPLSCGAFYLVPQTLYKLHPDFDRLVAGVLSADLSGCVVFIKALEASTTEGLMRRMSRALLVAGVAAERVVFVPRMGLSEFSGLVGLADVVLDTFPVGGGRSSFEIFAVGTPIVMLYNRTSVLQLTYGMYATMGLEGAIGNASDSDPSVSLVTYSEDHFIRSAVAIATDVDLNARTRELILANNHRLFEQDSVVEEWELFLEGIVSVPRPPPNERNSGLAVDASDFPRKVPWCSKRSLSTDTEEREHSAVPAASASSSSSASSASSAYAGSEIEAEVGVTAGIVDKDDGGGDDVLVRREPELLYAINFTIAPPREGEESMQLSAEVYEGMDPMEEASRLRREGALDYMQYRWVGAVLCRGIERLKRPVVWSTFVRVDGGPRALLEVRQGDDLHQVARWHCDRHSLGAERVPVLSTKLKKELPQHADPEWVSARAGDRSCSTPPAPATPPSSPSSPTTPDHAGHRPIRIGSKNAHPHGSTKTLSAASGGAAAVAGTIGGGRRGRDKSSAREGEVTEPNDENEKDDGEVDGGGGGRGGGCVTLAITTCKRLRAFLGTAEGLQALLGPLPQGSAGEAAALPRVCQVLVVDDGSSPKDRGVMLSSFPRFTFVFKGPEDAKGHAGSMNMILSLTKARYLLYVEDDWWAVHESPLPPRSGVGNFLWRAMEVLTKSTERVSQVLVNDQSTRNCAWGDTAICTPDIRGKSAGWPRFTAGSLAEQEHGHRPESHSNVSATHSNRCPGSEVGGTGHCGSGGPRMSSSNDDGIDVGHPPARGDSDMSVEYRLHEFGLLCPLHDFTHWPGFSLNPALWDLERLDASYRRRYGRQIEFDPTDIRFEQSISAELLDAGVAVAHLPDVTFRHVGAGQSAYGANDMRRPWD